MKKAVTALFIGFGILLQNDANIIEWNSDYKLKMEDFKGIPDYSLKYSAISAIEIKPVIFEVLDSFHYNFEVLFIKNESWIKKDSKNLLEHEQLHFDIAELFARKLRKITMEGVFTDDESFMSVIDSVYCEWSSFDNIYDKSTMYSILSEEQNKWKIMIRDSLVLYEKYRLK